MFFGLFKERVKMVTVKRNSKTKPVAAPKKKTAKPRTKAGKGRGKLKAAKTPLEEVGRITHYFPHVKAGVILVTKGAVALGDELYIKGSTTNFKQKVNSLQVNNAPIKQAKAGQEIGLLVKARVRHNDIVYKL